MTGPYAENCLVLEVEAGAPDKFIRIDPNCLDGDYWLHQLAEFDRTLKVIPEPDLP